MSILKSLNSWGNPQNAFYLLLAIYIAGFIGLRASTTQAIFQALTPLNLLLTGMILFHFETSKNKYYAIFLIISFIFGFGIEVIGVKTGYVFGDYQYSEVLGLQLLSVPLIIGVNWAILIYCSGILAKKMSENIFIQALIAALIMTLLDYFIEPVAVALNFWQWEDTSIPLRNYLAWFVFSYIMVLFYFKIHPNSNNPLAVRLLLILLSFFVLLNFI